MREIRMAQDQGYEALSLGDFAARYPSIIPFLEAQGIDFCCGGKRPLLEVLREHSLDYAALESELVKPAAQLVGENQALDVKSLETPDLIEHIINRYHAALRQKMPEIQALAVKVVRAHGGQDQRLSRIEVLLGQCAQEMSQHLKEEEETVFPAILHHDKAGQAMVTGLEDDHDKIGALLQQITTLSDNFLPPTWACATYNRFLAGLRWLVEDTHRHVHLENNVLFARVTPC